MIVIHVLTVWLICAEAGRDLFVDAARYVFARPKPVPTLDDDRMAFCARQLLDERERMFDDPRFVDKEVAHLLGMFHA